MKRYLPIFIVGTLVCAALVLGFLKSESSDEKSINFAIQASVETFDPAKVFSDDSLTILSQVLEPLYQYHYLKRPYEVEPLLASEKPEITHDGKRYTVRIKKGVIFHPHSSYGDSREVKAKDFIVQIKRLALKNLKSPGQWLFSGRLKGFNEFSDKVGSDYKKIFKNEISGLKVVDDYTLEFNLNKPDSNFIYFLAMNFVVPIPEELVKATQNNLDSVLLGTGPYLLDQWVVDEKFSFVKFQKYREDYYPGVGDRYANTKNLLEASRSKIPFIDRFNIFRIKDNQRLWDQFLDGELDFISVPKPFLSRIFDLDGELSDSLKGMGIELKHFSSLSSRWIGFNMRDPIIGENVNLRKAMAYALNYDEYISKLMGNSNMRANSIFLAGIPGYNPSQRLPFDHSIDRARHFMAKAGYPEGKGLPELTYSTRNNTELSLEEAKLIQRNFAEIGIKLKIQVLDFADFLKKGRAGELQIFTDQWIYDYPDSENLVQLLLSQNHPGINKSGFKSKELDELYYKLINTSSIDEKKLIMAEVESLVNSQVPWIMLTFESNYILNYAKVKNIRKSSFIRNFVKYLDVK